MKCVFIHYTSKITKTTFFSGNKFTNWVTCLKVIMITYRHFLLAKVCIKRDCQENSKQFWSLSCSVPENGQKAHELCRRVHMYLQWNDGRSIADTRWDLAMTRCKNNSIAISHCVIAYLRSPMEFRMKRRSRPGPFVSRSALSELLSKNPMTSYMHSPFYAIKTSDSFCSYEKSLTQLRK